MGATCLLWAATGCPHHTLPLGTWVVPCLSGFSHAYHPPMPGWVGAGPHSWSLLAILPVCPFWKEGFLSPWEQWALVQPATAPGWFLGCPERACSTTPRFLPGCLGGTFWVCSELHTGLDEHYWVSPGWVPLYNPGGGLLEGTPVCSTLPAWVDTWKNSGWNLEE